MATEAAPASSSWIRSRTITNPRGTQLETAVVNWLHAHGWPYARRLAKEGAKDKGDVTLGDGIPLTIEAKNRKGFDLAGTQRELKAEMVNANVPWGFAIHKKRGTTDVGQYYAVLPVGILMDILDHCSWPAFRSGNETPPSTNGPTMTFVRNVPPRVKRRAIPR